MALTNQQVSENIQAAMPGAILHSEEQYGALILEIAKDKIYPLVEWLQKDEQMQINFLTLLGGMHYPGNGGRELAVVYQLHSLVHNFRLRLKVYMPVANPHIPSITPLYDGANWQERETFDFFGILFDGHPDLRRILNEDSMDYFPMRKEYKLEDATREDKDDRYFGR